jgi:NAD(P)-dependent dehydrogenase (short-subunit alcohol dehydrogenase family)
MADSTSAGIGYATVVELARHRAKVYMATRTEKRAVAALDRFYKENPSVEQGSVVWLPLELSDFGSVTKAAQMFLKNEERLDILGEC